MNANAGDVILAPLSDACASQGSGAASRSQVGIISTDEGFQYAELREQVTLKAGSRYVWHSGRPSPHGLQGPHGSLGVDSAVECAKLGCGCAVPHGPKVTESNELGVLSFMDISRYTMMIHDVLCWPFRLSHACIIGGPTGYP